MPTKTEKSFPFHLHLFPPTTENILESKQVLNISAKEDGSFELQLDDEIVTVSDKEEFWIKDEKWVQAQDLEEGDLLQTEDGDFVSVDGIEVREGSFMIDQILKRLESENLVDWGVILQGWMGVPGCNHRIEAKYIKDFVTNKIEQDQNDVSSALIELFSVDLLEREEVASLLLDSR